MKEGETRKPLEQEEKNFQERLLNNIGTVDPEFIEQLQEKENPLIISVACGAGLEFPALNELLQNARLIGIDINPEAAVMGEEMAKNYGFSLEIKTADAREEVAYRDDEGEPLKADLILIRSPNPSTSEPGSNWNEVVSQAANHLEEGGLFCCTVERDEQKYMQTIMERHLEQVESNEDPLSHKSAGPFSERFVLIGSNKGDG